METQVKIQLGYNTLINTAFCDLGVRNGLEVTLHKETEKKGLELKKALEKEVLVEINFIENTYVGRGPLTYFGLVVAKATGRDSGAWVPPSVNFISGQLTSGGSRINWTTEATKGTVMRFKIPELIFNKYKNRYKKIESKIVEELKDINVEDLI